MFSTSNCNLRKRVTTPIMGHTFYSSGAVCLNERMDDDDKTLSSERLMELRQLIRAKISSDQVQGKIRECVTRVEKEENGDEILLQLLEEKGLVDEVMAGLKLRKESVPRRPSPAVTSGECSKDMKIQMKEG